MRSQSQTATTVRKRIRNSIVLLGIEYGIPEWRSRDDPVSVLVQTILSQNTSDINSGTAFRSLRARFHKWEDVAEADVDAIARCISSGGLGNIKAKRIKQALKEIIQKRGRLELNFLKELSLSEAEGWLLGLPGVGEKTARVVLLFSLGMPALPVDTHVWRVSKRLGLIRLKASLHEAHSVLGEIVLAEDVYRFHILMIEHGRRTCRARNPRCPVCVLREICPSYRVLSEMRNGWLLVRKQIV